MRTWLTIVAVCVFAMVSTVFFYGVDVVLAQTAENTVVPLENPLGEEETSIEEVVGRAVTAVLGIVGMLTLIVFIAGGAMWLFSGGSDEKIRKGLDMMLYAGIGLLVIFGAYGILQSVLNAILK